MARPNWPKSDRYSKPANCDNCGRSWDDCNRRMRTIMGCCMKCRHWQNRVK